MNFEEEKRALEQAVSESRIVLDRVSAQEKENRRLWIISAIQTAIIVALSCCFIFAMVNSQKIANEAMINALETVSEMEVVSETTTTQTVEGDLPLSIMSKVSSIMILLRI